LFHVDSEQCRGDATAEPHESAFTRDGWLFELKLDGYRLIASMSHGEALLLTRNGNDYTSVFPEVARAVKAAAFDDCIIDGEVVCWMPTASKLLSFAASAADCLGDGDPSRAVELPATFYAFDLLAFEDFDLRPLGSCAARSC